MCEDAAVAAVVVVRDHVERPAAPEAVDAAQPVGVGLLGGGEDHSRVPVDRLGRAVTLDHAPLHVRALVTVPVALQIWLVPELPLADRSSVPANDGADESRELSDRRGGVRLWGGPE